MRRLWNWVKNNPNRTMFLLPILLVAGISISHVVSWYDITNPFNWAIYLSIAIEVGAMTALVAATNKIKGGVWFMFGLITLIQMIGNIFFSFKEIDDNGQLFKSWVELTGPLWDMIGSDSTDVISMKRWLAFLQGGLLPIISLTSLHFFVKYEKPEEKTEDLPPISEKVIEEEITPLNQPKENVINTKEIWGNVSKLKEEGKLPDTNDSDLMDETTFLANSQYREELNYDLEDTDGFFQEDVYIPIIKPKEVIEVVEESPLEDEDNEPSVLVEEENIEDEVNFVNEYVEIKTNIEDPMENEPQRNLGRELAKNWRKIVRNNSIGKV